MTNQATVKVRYPRARAYRYSVGLRTHYIVWSDRANDRRLAEGKTPGEAWRLAAEKLKHP
jgi:hypothetical protein